MANKKVESQEVKRLREFVDRLARDGYPTAPVEHAADRMQQLEDLVISQDQEMQVIGRLIDSFRTMLDELQEHSLFRRQAE